MTAPRLAVRDIRPSRLPTRLALVDVILPGGVVIFDCELRHGRRDEHVWLPEGTARFLSPAHRDAFSRAVFAAVRAVAPEVLRDSASAGAS